MVLELFVAALMCGTVAEDMDVSPPQQVDVLPVFFVPQGEPLPAKEQKARLMKHLRWAQDRYQEMLGGRDTFRIAKQTPNVVRGKQSLAFYKKQPEGASPHFVGELLEHCGFNRFNCPYIFLVIVVNSHEDFPVGGGRPFNGGYGTGGGIAVMSSYHLDRAPNFHSTLEHELGHSFGLVHVDCYGHDMQTNRSIMSYNPAHHTNGFRPSTTPGEFIPEDVRGLAMNRRCFAKFRFDPQSDLPDGYSMRRIVWLGSMNIVGQPPGTIEVTTPSGDLYGGKASNIVQCEIKRNEGENTFDAARMWHSAKSETGWISLRVALPVPVRLTKMAIYTQHSGKYHAANRARIEIEQNGQFRQVAECELDKPDARVSLPPTRGQVWQVHLRAGASKVVVVRGLRFGDESGEIFPPAVPYGDP